jgi:hypothetical protein
LHQAHVNSADLKRILGGQATFSSDIDVASDRIPNDFRVKPFKHRLDDAKISFVGGVRDCGALARRFAILPCLGHIGLVL